MTTTLDTAIQQERLHALAINQAREELRLARLINPLDDAEGYDREIEQMSRALSRAWKRIGDLEKRRSVR